MSDEMHEFLLAINNAEIVPVVGGESYPMGGIITQCDEWITEGWRADNDSITPPMYAAALLNEASTQDKCVERKESHPSYPRALRHLAMMILAKDGQGVFFPSNEIFKIKES